MANGLLATLPVQLVCQLITPENYSTKNFTQITPTMQQTILLPNGYTAFPDVGVAMKYFANDLTWNLARQHCMTEGGNLAVIDSFEKAKYANDLRKSNPRGPFLGIHKLYDNFQWVGVKTGLPLSFIPWKSGINLNAATTSCTALYGDLGGRVGPWECNKSWSYVCEIPIPLEYQTECPQYLQDQTNQRNKPPVNETVSYDDSARIPVN